MPDYKICPFSNNDLLTNRLLPKSNKIDDFFSSRFPQKKYIYTSTGREAIYLALESYKLQANDVVTIITTTDNYYISGCVTNEIEKFCKWSRVIEQNTKLLFVNHEFGYPYEELLELKKYQLPIIEDCAHSFFSSDKKNIIGTVGDYVIYSFPKIFPIQIGGLLVNNANNELLKKSVLGESECKYIKNVLSYYIQSKDEIIDKRLHNYLYLSTKFKELGFTERFELTDDIVPGVFMFQKGSHKIELPEFKKYFYAHGIQCSVFYGEESFFLPVHQALNEDDLDYFIEVMKSF